MARWRLVPSIALPNYDPIKAKVQNLKRPFTLLPFGDPPERSGRAWWSAKPRKGRCERLSTTHILRRACCECTAVPLQSGLTV